MAKIKVKFRSSTVEGNPGSIFYYLSHQGKTRQINTGIKILPADWDEINKRIRRQEGNLAIYQNKIDADLKLLDKIISNLDRSNPSYTVRDIVSQFHDPRLFISVVDFLDDQIMFLKDCKRFGTSRNYRLVSNVLKSFLNGQELNFSEITPAFVERFGDFLKRKGMIKNSQSFYMRVLRAAYNKGVRLGYAEQSLPFRDTYTGIDHTRKLAVNDSIIKRLVQMDLDKKKSLAFARDMFLFSFYSRGMAYVDIAYLKKSDLKDGYISYSRHKTGQNLSIKIEPCLRSIIERYADKVIDSPYVFPIIRSVSPEDSFNEYRSALRVFNSRLKKLADILGQGVRLSSYTARHTWATAARQHNIPLSIISAGMGHSSEKTTQIYLNSIENSRIDDANRGLIDIINQPT